MTNELNDEQRGAVIAGDGPVLIVAGPGTGKTKTLTARIAHLVQSGMAKPSQILALTFTKKAAQEVLTRLATMLQKDEIPTVCTFHALCMSLLDHNYINIATELQIINVIRQLKKPVEFKGKSARELKLLISKIKNSPASNEHKNLIAAYNQVLNAQGLCDFDDLLVRARDELANKGTKSHYTHILVDEFQDTNALQYELLQLLRSTDNLFAIGDPNQSIYGFRGASSVVFDQFKADFPACVQITLGTNYRSVPAIVRLSNALFGDTLQTELSEAGQVQAIEVLNEYSEANWVLAEIQRQLGGSDLLKTVGGLEGKAHLKDFAILYRSRSAAKALQSAIDASGLPYQVVGDGSPYEQPEVQALINQLRAVEVTAPPHHRAERIITGASMRLTNELRQFVSTLVRFDTTKQALAYIDSLGENFYDPRADAITLLTIHAAKGLEFRHVFLVGVNEAVLPSERADVLEEKRLFYVAITRAKENLDILYSRFRKGAPAKPSRFITQLQADILPRIIDAELTNDQRRAAKRRSKRAQTTLF